MRLIHVFIVFENDEALWHRRIIYQVYGLFIGIFPALSFRKALLQLHRKYVNRNEQRTFCSRKMRHKCIRMSYICSYIRGNFNLTHRLFMMTEKQFRGWACKLKLASCSDLMHHNWRSTSYCSGALQGDKAVNLLFKNGSNHQPQLKNNRGM